MKIKFLSSAKFMAMGLALIVLFSCQQHKREIERLNSSKDSILQVVSEREQVITDYISSFNDIQDRLDSIKAAQKLLNVELSATDVERQSTSKEKIINDITLINNLINENKKTIAILQKRLKDSNMKSAELQKMIDNLNRQIEEKDLEIAALNTQIDQMKIDISNLGRQVNTLTEESAQKSATIEKQKEEMNIAYYCFGTRDELISNNVIEKTGGVLGMGRSYKMKEDFNHDYFMKVDIREFKEVMLMVKKAQLLTTHPDGSFRFSTNDEKLVDYLYIEQAEKFWNVSKYMVIMVEPK